MGNLYIQSRTL